MKIIFIFFITLYTSQTKKIVLEETPNIHHIKIINDYKIYQIQNLFNKSEYNKWICPKSNKKICKIREDIYIQTSICLINNYNFNPDQFARLSNIYEFNTDLDGVIFFLKNKEFSLNNFPKCIKTTL